MMKWKEYGIKQSSVILRFCPTPYMKMGFRNTTIKVSLDITSPILDSSPETPAGKAA
jgi:hypothetical protein